MIPAVILTLVLLFAAALYVTGRHDRRHGWLPKAPRDELLRFGEPISHVHVTDDEKSQS